MLWSMKAIAKRVLFCVPLWRCKQEFKRQAFRRFNERPVEYAFVFRIVGEVYPRTILDVGTGTTALPSLLRNCGAMVTATDNIRDYWPTGMVNVHYHILDDDITNPSIGQAFNLITCISVLEHIEDADRAVRGMFRLLAPKGHLIMTFPYCEKNYIKDVYGLSGSTYGQRASYVTQAYSRKELDRWMVSNGGMILEQEYWRFWNGEYWTVGAQVIPPRRVGVGELHQLTCVHIQKG